MKISIVIPCYSSEKFLERTVSEIREEMEKHDNLYNIILVNDCSPDDTFSVIKKIANKYENIIGVNLAKNFGQHSALMSGFQYVDGDIVVCMDDDGQTPASEIYKIVDAIDDETDVVYGRYQKKKHSLFRNFGSFVNSYMLKWLLNKPDELYISSFFGAKRFVIEEIKNYHNPYAYVMGLVLRSTKGIKNIDVMHKKREIGDSGYTLKKLLDLWLNGFTAFSVKPLRIASKLGVTSAMAGFIFLLYVIIRRLILGDQGVVGWASIMSVQLFLGGCILCVLGIIGEYVGRMYICINNAPQFVVKELVKSEKMGYGNKQ